MKKMTFPTIAAALFVAAPALAGAQTPPPTPAPAPAPSSAQAPADRPAKADSLKGELVKVDADAKTITVKGSDNIETVFAYSDTTEVAGGREGVAGLATKAGSKVTVHFKTDMGKKTATKIEVQGAS